MIAWEKGAPFTFFLAFGRRGGLYGGGRMIAPESDYWGRCF